MFLTARNEKRDRAALAALKQQHLGGLIISVDTFYYSQIRRMAALASQHGARDWPIAGVRSLDELRVAGVVIESNGQDLARAYGCSFYKGFSASSP